MAISSFCNTQPVLIPAAGVFAGSQSKERSVMLGIDKPFEISGFNNNGKRCMRLNANKALMLLLQDLLYLQTQWSHKFSFLNCKV